MTQHPEIEIIETKWGSITVEDLFYIAGFVWDPTTETYHARQDCLQRFGGYNDFLMKFFDFATSMDQVGIERGAEAPQNL